MVEAKTQFEPKIIGFLCNWCTGAASDLAGTTRAQYPPNVHPIRVMCSGTVDTVYLIKALLAGADSVMLGGCHPGDCHYVEQNYKALRRFLLLRRVLTQMGVEAGRLKLFWASAAEGAIFAAEINKFVEEVRALGPLTWPSEFQLIASIPMTEEVTA